MEEILTKINDNLDRIANYLETYTYHQIAFQNTDKHVEELQRELEYYKTQCIVKDSK